MLRVTPTRLPAGRAGRYALLVRCLLLVGVALCSSRCSLGDFDGLSSGLNPADTLNNGNLSGASGASTDLSSGGASGAAGSQLDTSGGAAGSSAATDPPDGGPKNLIFNPGFEAGSSRWSAIGSCTVAQSTDNPRSGQVCLLIANRTESWQGPGYDLVGTLSATKTYIATVWARVADGSSPVNLTYKHRCADDAGDPSYTPIGSNLVTTNWTEVTASFTVPDCVLVDSLLYVEGPPAGTDFYIDDTSLMPSAP